VVPGELTIVTGARVSLACSVTPYTSAHSVAQYALRVKCIGKRARLFDPLVYD